MKHLFTFIIFLIPFFALCLDKSFAQHQKIPLQDLWISTANAAYKHDPPFEDVIVNGKLKSIKITDYEASEKNGKIVKGKMKIDGESFSYNDQGQLISQTAFDKNGTILREHIYQYDNKGNNISHKMISLLKDNEFEATQEYIYDEAGNWLEERTFLGKETRLVYKFGYDKDGNWISLETKIFGSQGDYTFAKASYINGKIRELLVGPTPDSLYRKIIYQYDPNGNLVEFNEYRNPKSTEPNDKRVFIYNANNKPLEENYYSMDGLILKQVSTYDHHGNLIEWTSEDETGLAKVTNQYDDKNRLIERTFEDNEESATSNFTLDQYGNWIRCVDKTEGKITGVTEREITYW